MQNPDMISPRATTCAQPGFTLVELAIVLVIIGLIIGGIFVGLYLIEAASLRADISQLKKFSAAVNTFRLKFNAIPGDMTSADATAYGMLGAGNRSGRIEENGGMVQFPTYGLMGMGEPRYTFYHLAQARLIPGNFDPNGNLGSTFLPAISSHPDHYWMMISTTYDMSIWFFAGATSTAIYNQDMINATRVGGVYAPVYTPIQAYNIDIKLDDGVPSSGLVRPVRMAWPNGYIDNVANNCVLTAASTSYNLTSKTIWCDLILRGD